MKQKSLNLSGKIDKDIVEAISCIKKSALELRIPFFLVGATARDFILEKTYDMPVSRATLDIDLGILVESWDSFGKLKSDLIDSGQFVAMKEIQRLFYMNSRYIDLIPFGPIGGRGQTVKWPPDLDTEMNITGFKEAYESAIPLVIQNQPQIEIKIISLAGLAVLKLFSWNDRRHERNKDAADLALILRSYTDAGNAERIPDEMPDFVEQDDFDYIAAGARLLGKDISRIFRGNTVQKILEILEDEVGDSEQHRLIEDMIQSRAIAGDHYGKMLNLLEQMKRGIEEGN